MNTITIRFRKISVAALLMVSLLPFNSFAQKKDAPKPVRGYGDASYTVSTAEQFMSAWLVAGPVLIDRASGDPVGSTQMDFFKEEIPPILVSSNKIVAPLESKGKQYPWMLVKTSNDVIDL